MKKFQIALVVAGLLVLSAAAVFGGLALARLGEKQFTFQTEYVEKHYSSSNPVQAVKIIEGSSDIRFQVSDSDRVEVTYFENSRERYRIIEEPDGSLSDTKQTHPAFGSLHFTLFERRPPLTIALPADYGGDLEVSALNSKVTLGKQSFGLLDIDVSNGSLAIDSIKAQNISLGTLNGKVVGSDIQSTGSVELESTNGSLELDGVSFAMQLEAKTVNGSIEIRVIGALEEFDIQTSTVNGSSNVADQQGSGGRSISLSTVNGKINLTFQAE